MTYYVGRTTGSGVTALTGDFEAGTNGSTIKTTDPGSLTPWSAIGGTAPTYSTTSPAHGSLCAACPSTTLSWTTASVTELWGRYYLNASVLPTGSSFSTLVTGIQSDGSTIAFSIRLAQASVAGSAGKLNVQGVTSGGNKYGTVAISTTGWIRIEFHAVINATTGSIEVKLYNSADSNTPDDTILYSGINTGTGVATLRYGAGWAATTIYMDQMVGFASAYPGPFPVNSVAPAVSGSAPVGSMLACDGGTWNNTFTLGYQWTSNGSNIVGATSSTYVTQAGDVGNAIGCTVTATGQQATNESASQASSNTVTVTSSSPPGNTVAPAVTGTATVGSTLTTNNGTWTGSPTGYSYQWTRNGSNIASATASTYTLVDADDATTVLCVVTATNASGSASANSNSNSITEPVATNSVAPVASGTAAVNSTVSATTGTWANMGGTVATYAYQWQDSANGTTGWANVTGATSSNYTIAVGELNKYLRCNVTATNTGGTSSATSSNVLGPVAAAATTSYNLGLAANGGRFLRMKGIR